MHVGLWLTALWTVLIDGRTLDPAFLRTAVASCSEVLADERCSAADEAEAHGPEVSELLVQLRTDPALTTVTVTVPRADRPAASRTLRLDPTATREEHARAAGLVVAAQVLALRYERLAPEAADTHLPVSAAQPAASESLRLDLAGSLGTARDRGPPRVGLLLRASWLPLVIPLGVAVALRGAYPPDTPRVLWGGVSAGVLWRLAPPRAWLALEARLEALLQHSEVMASEGEQHERAGALRVGGQLGLELLLRLAGTTWLFLGLEAALLRPRVALYVHGAHVATEPLASGALLLGLRYAP